MSSILVTRDRLGPADIVGCRVSEITLGVKLRGGGLETAETCGLCGWWMEAENKESQRRATGYGRCRRERECGNDALLPPQRAVANRSDHHPITDNSWQSCASGKSSPPSPLLFTETFEVMRPASPSIYSANEPRPR